MMSALRKIAILCLAMAGYTDVAIGRCHTVQSEIGGIVFKRDTDLVRYRFELKDRRWRIDPFGWHANAMIECEKCPDAAIRGGYIWMSNVTDDKGLPTIEEHSAFIEWLGATWFAPRPQGTLALRGETFQGQWSGLPTVARRFLIEPDGTSPIDLVAITVSDGCVRIALYLEINATAPGSLAAILQPLFTAIPIQQTVAPIARR